MSLAKLVVDLQANYKGLTAGLGIARNDIAKTVAHIAHVTSQLDTMKGKLNEIGPEYAVLKELSNAFANSTDLAGESADFLHIKLRYMADTMDVLQGQTERYEQTLKSAVATFQLRLLTDALRRQSQSTDTIRRLWNGNSNALVKYNQTAAQTTRIHQTMAQPRPTLPPQPTQLSTSRAMIKHEGGGTSKVSMALQVAQIAMQGKAAGVMERAMTKARGAIATIGQTVGEVSSATNRSVSAMDRFRVGLMAAKVDPSLNTLPGLINSIAAKAASAVENFRGFGDAALAGLPAILTAVAGGMGKVMGAGDSLQATVSKVVSQLDLKKQALDRVAKIYPTAGTAVDMLKRAMDVVAPIAQKVAGNVDLASDAVRQGTIWTRNFAYLATGAFVKTGTTADAYSRGMYHAMLPTRLMYLESKFAQGSLTLMRRAMVTLSHPIHAVAMAMHRTKGEFSELRNNLPPLTGGLQIGTRGFRAFAHATFFSAKALSAVKGAATPITWVGKQIWNLVRPAKAAKVGLDGVATGGHRAGIVLRGVTAAAGGTVSALTRVASAGTKVAATKASGFMSALPGKAGLALASVAAIGVAMVGLGMKTAMATEKNQAVFGTMVHDLNQGKAIVASIQGAKASSFFDNQELLNSSRLLYKAGVATTDLAAKTDQFAKIALGGSVDMSLLTDRYMQGATLGSFGIGQINDLQREGIAIYSALEAVTGKSGDALQKMISDGEIGITQMDAALAHLTEGHGIYADALVNVGNTSSGMLSRIKNNVTQALGAIMGIGNSALQPALSVVVKLTEYIKENALSIAPVIMQLVEAIKAIFFSLWTVASSIWTSIFGVASTTFASILRVTLEWITKFRWFFTNIIPIVQFVGLSILSILVGVFNDLAYWLTTKVPAYLGWFADNWKSIFSDLAVGTMTVFKNLGVNIKNAMGVIWNFIKSGGTSGLEITWTPLLDGFKSTVAKLPEIPDRALSALEEGMQTQIQEIGTGMANSFDSMMADANASMEAAVATPPELVRMQATPGGQNDAAKTDLEKAKSVENKAVQVRSEEGQKAFASMLRTGLKDEKKTAEKIAADSRDHLAQIRTNTDNAPKIKKRSFAGT